MEPTETIEPSPAAPTGPVVELRVGRYQRVLGPPGPTCVVITDPPYSKRTHAGQRSGGPGGESRIIYPPFSRRQAHELCAFASSAMWFVAFGDHTTSQWLLSRWLELGHLGWIVPWVKPDAMPRFRGDGPASATEWIMVGRPRRNMRGGEHGSRPGFYLHGQMRKGALAGQKPVDLVRKIVRDYSMPQDTVIDPMCGSGTMLVAAAAEGRHALGAEQDKATAEVALERIRRDTAQREMWLQHRESVTVNTSAATIGTVTPGNTTQ